MMKLVIISGRSGSGKSTALHQLEDEGYYAIDNLPISLLPGLVEELSQSTLSEHEQVAVCIDARNSPRDIAEFTNFCRRVSDKAVLSVVYLDADNESLIQRFSETRRRHPLSNKQVALAEAIERERHLLEPIFVEAGLNIDTTGMNVHDLRQSIRERLIGPGGASMSVLLQSFGFKRGIPIDADIVFDLRMLPNPHWDEQLRSLTGDHPAVREFLDAAEDVEEMFEDIFQFLRRWLPRLENSNRSYVTIALGCTGGQHRSVYMASRLAQALAPFHTNLQVRHRELA